LNDLLRAFCRARPRHLFYGSPAFVPATDASATQIPAIAFPNIPGGIEWAVRLSVPRVDLHAQSASLPPEMTLQPGQFSARIRAEICLDCRQIVIDRQPPRPEDPRPDDDDKSPNDDFPDQPKGTHPLRELTCWRLALFAIGHLQNVFTMSGEDAIALNVDQVEIVDIEPNALESLLECLLMMILQGALAGIRLPVRDLAFEPFAPAGPPFIEDHQVKLRGNV
jgi:hypothetical protein